MQHDPVSYQPSYSQQHAMSTAGNRGRLVRSKALQRHVRRDIYFSPRAWRLDDQLRALCGQSGMVDEDGKPRLTEACRLAILTHLTRTYPDRVNVAVEYAVRAQKLILISAMGRRIARIFSTHNRTAGQTGRFTKTSVHITTDDWTAEALQRLEMPYRRPDGIVDDVRLYADVMRSGLQDQSIWAIAAAYQRRVVRIRRSLEQLEKYVGAVLIETVGKESFPRERTQRERTVES